VYHQAHPNGLTSCIIQHNGQGLDHSIVLLPSYFGNIPTWLGLYHILSSVGWFFEFVNNRQFQFFKYFRIKGPPALVLWKEVRIKDFLVLVISKTSKNHGVSWKNWERTSDSLADSLKFETNLRTAVIIPKPVIWEFWEPIGKWLYTQVDNWWVSVPHPKNRPTLVLSRCKRPLVHVMCLFHSFYLC